MWPIKKDMITFKFLPYWIVNFLLDLCYVNVQVKGTVFWCRPYRMTLWRWGRRITNQWRWRTSTPCWTWSGETLKFHVCFNMYLKIWNLSIFSITSFRKMPWIINIGKVEVRKQEVFNLYMYFLWNAMELKIALLIFGLSLLIKFNLWFLCNIFIFKYIWNNNYVSYKIQFFP